jgi:polygalacturonase
MENAAISADVTVTYNIVKTTIGLSLISDENGAWTTNMTVAGNLDIGSMLPFLN